MLWGQPAQCMFVYERNVFDGRAGGRARSRVSTNGRACKTVQPRKRERERNKLKRESVCSDVGERARHKERARMI